MINFKTIPIFLLLLILKIVNLSHSKDYRVGPNQTLKTISAVPWASLNAGDNVYIHWKKDPYKEKWVINRRGTAKKRIKIIGVNGPKGQQATISGNGAKNAKGLDFWNERRGLIKIGGSNIPKDGLPAYITIDNLQLINAYKSYNFIDKKGNSVPYSNNAASVYIEKGEYITIKNCTIYGSGNGIFIGEFNGKTQHILIEKNYIYGNGVVNRIYEHNTYTEAIGITYQYNRMGPLRAGALGNNLKDRSAGLVVKFNWIKGGNRLLDLVDAQGSAAVSNHISYAKTHVYGNVLIKPNDKGNSQVLHYGGDSKSDLQYRKGTLYFYNNTVVSERPGLTTLVRLSTNDESAEIFNNIIYHKSKGSFMGITAHAGSIKLYNNWLRKGWKNSHETFNGKISNTNNIISENPQFVNELKEDFMLKPASLCKSNGTILKGLVPKYDIVHQYKKHFQYTIRPVKNTIDIGAYGLSSVGIKSASTNGTIVYPNPTTDNLTIQGFNQSNSKIELVSTLGTTIYCPIVIQDKTVVLNTRNLKKGIYYICFKKGKHNLYTKFIKE